MEQKAAKKGGPGDASRRQFMKTAGKIALYTPPAVMLLMHPDREAVACASFDTYRRRKRFHTTAWNRRHRRFRHRRRR